MCICRQHNTRTFVTYGIILIRLIIFINFFCITFTIDQDAYLTGNGLKHYFKIDAANAMLTLFARNMSMFIPEAVYIYVFWPKQNYISETLNSRDSFEFKLKPMSPHSQQQYKFESMLEEDDSDLLQELHKNGYK